MLPINDFDAILGMDWLAGYHIVKVDETEKNIQFLGEQKKILTHRISALKATWLL